MDGLRAHKRKMQHSPFAVTSLKRSRAGAGTRVRTQSFRFFMGRLKIGNGDTESDVFLSVRLGAVIGKIKFLLLVS